MADQELPFALEMAPFPEGFQGDLDETFQQAYANTKGAVIGNFLTGLILPPGSTLPSSDQGPVAMGGSWYFWDPTTNQYLPQSVSQKTAKNYCKNSAYGVQQYAPILVMPTGTTPHWDMAQWRNGSIASVLTLSPSVGPTAGADNDLIPSAITYTVGSTLVTTPVATDLYAHEHLIEGIDIAMLQGEVTSLSFSCLASASGTYSIYLTNMNRDQSFVANFTITGAQAGQWVRVKIPGIPAFPTAGTWGFSEGQVGLYIGVVLALGGNYKTTLLNQWQSALFCGSAANSNMLAVTNNRITLTGFKFEAAANPTYYQAPSFADEYEQMTRYYFTTFNYQSTSAGIAMTAVCHVAAACSMYFVFPRRMCKAPTVVPYSPSGFTAGNVFNASTGANIATATLAAYQKGVSDGVTVTGATKADVIQALIRADARLGP
jgi:hypothetical protein